MALASLVLGFCLAAPAPAEVIVIGTLHGVHYVDPNYHPGMLRRLLTLAKPDVLVVEARDEDLAAPGGGKAPPDMTGIAIPWANRHGVPVKPFDAWEPEWRKQTEALWSDLEKTPEGKAKLAKVPSETEVHADRFPDFNEISAEYVLSPEFAKRDHEVREAQARVLGEGPGDLFWKERTRRMVANLRKIILASPSKRVVVVTGAAHRGDLEAALEGSPGVRVLPAASLTGSGQVTGYDGAEAEPGEMETMLISLLQGRRANREPDKVNVRFAKAVRNAYAQGAARPAMLEFFDGELAYLARDYPGAEKLFAAAAADASEKDLTWGIPLSQVALLREGNMLDLLGRRDDATALYRRVVTPNLKNAAERMLERPFARPR